MDSSKILKSVSIAQFYAGKSVFVTGATGFMGKVIVEKLLRDCGDVKCIYILVRMKRGVDPLRRYYNYVRDIIFDRIRETSPEQLKKIRLVKGDISEENLDIEPEDEKELTEELNVIFHCAAKAKFSLTLREALNFNTCGTLRVLQLAAKSKKLLVFSYVSTSYCCPNEKVFDERYYPAPADPYEVIELMKSTHETALDAAEARLMKGYPNTYALSKILAEDLVHSFKDKFRAVISRPSIVISAWQEPYTGWVESKKSGLVGILLARGRGVIRVIHCKPNSNLEVIPVDICNNAILALTCKRALMEDGNEVLYANLTNSDIQKMTLREYFDYEMKLIKEFPLDLQLWWPYCVLTDNFYYYQFRRFCYHYVPAVFGDFWSILFGQKPALVNANRKFDRGISTYTFYHTRNYLYKNNQFMSLPNELSEADKEIFFCDLRKIDLKKCIKDFILGVRTYIIGIKDEDSLEFRKGLLTLFWWVDLATRAVYSIVLLIIGILLLMFAYSPSYVLQLLVDIFYSAKFLVSNYLVIRPDVIERCNRS